MRNEGKVSWKDALVYMLLIIFIFSIVIICSKCQGKPIINDVNATNIDSILITNLPLS